MGFQANVLKVMIASPSDVADERAFITEELYRWNDANAVPRELMLQPVKWETHSSPQMGAHPQTILNERLLLDADIVVGIFGTRIGTATPDFVSGSVEEIKRHVAAGKLAMLYFSHIPVDPNSIDPKQWTALQSFKTECKTGGLYAEFSSHDDLRYQFRQHLAIELNRPKYLWLPKPDAVIEPQHPELTDNERRLLVAAATQYGQILVGTTLQGDFVRVRDENFTDNSPRSAALWKSILKRLLRLGYLEQKNDEVYELTEEGFTRAEKEDAATPLEISLSFSGTPDRQMLCVKANKGLTLKQIDFLTSSKALVATTMLNEPKGDSFDIPLEHPKIVELFNAPRPDKNYSDHAGPAALRLIFTKDGRLIDVVLPIVLNPAFVANTQWIKLTGSQIFVLS